MQWILVNQEGIITSVERAEIISRELYNISRPVFAQGPREQDLVLFDWITHPDDPTLAALRVNTEHVIEVHPSCTLEKLIAVFPELTVEERFSLSSIIHQVGSFYFGLILPSTVSVRDDEYMIENGWIEPFIEDEGERDPKQSTLTR